MHINGERLEACLKIVNKAHCYGAPFLFLKVVYELFLLFINELKTWHAAWIT